MKKSAFFRIAAAFVAIFPEIRLDSQESIRRLTSREIIEAEPDSDNPEVEPLPFAIRGRLDCTMGAVAPIILINGVTKNLHELPCLLPLAASSLGSPGTELLFRPHLVGNGGEHVPLQGRGGTCQLQQWCRRHHPLLQHPTPLGAGDD